MGTQVVPVPIDSSCKGVIYHLGNHNYQCISVEDYNDRIKPNPVEHFWINTILILLCIFGIYFIVWIYYIMKEVGE